MLRLIRLLQLASPTLPVGAYTYSQGLEWAVESGAMDNETSAERWIGDALSHSLACLELPLVGALISAWQVADNSRIAQLNADFNASRESSELRAETVQMGWSLRRLLNDLPAFAKLSNWPGRLLTLDEPAFPTIWTAAVVAWDIPAEQALATYAWMWLENQVMAAVKAISLGQSAGQRLLIQLGEHIPELTQRAINLPEDGWSNFCPGLAIASSLHETQYTRLFRS